jgi:hypothetical protein
MKKETVVQVVLLGLALALLLAAILFRPEASMPDLPSPPDRRAAGGAAAGSGDFDSLEAPSASQAAPTETRFNPAGPTETRF